MPIDNPEESSSEEIQKPSKLDHPIIPGLQYFCICNEAALSQECKSSIKNNKVHAAETILNNILSYTNVLTSIFFDIIIFLCISIIFSFYLIPKCLSYFIHLK